MRIFFMYLKNNAIYLILFGIYNGNKAISFLFFLILVIFRKKIEINFQFFIQPLRIPHCGV